MRITETVTIGSYRKISSLKDGWMANSWSEEPEEKNLRINMKRKYIMFGEH